MQSRVNAQVICSATQSDLRLIIPVTIFSITAVVSVNLIPGSNVPKGYNTKVALRATLFFVNLLVFEPEEFT